jgi:hypothetical protein
MKNFRKPALVIIASTALSTTAFAQSAKFHAMYNPGTIVASQASCTAKLSADGSDGMCTEVDLQDAIAANVAKIRVAQGKELLGNLSAQVALFTMNGVVGGNGAKARSAAYASGAVSLQACNKRTDQCYTAVPHMVTLSSRQQELEATLGGVLEECSIALVDEDEDGLSDFGELDAGSCDFSPEEIKIMTNTVAAHSYNFVFPNLNVGNYVVKAKVYTEAMAEAAVTCGEPDEDGNGEDDTSYVDCIEKAEASASAEAMATISNAMLTVQEVRAAKGSLETLGGDEGL